MGLHGGPLPWGRKWCQLNLTPWHGLPFSPSPMPTLVSKHASITWLISPTFIKCNAHGILAFLNDVRFFYLGLAGGGLSFQSSSLKDTALTPQNIHKTIKSRARGQFPRKGLSNVNSNSSGEVRKLLKPHGTFLTLTLNWRVTFGYFALKKQNHYLGYLHLYTLVFKSWPSSTQRQIYRSMEQNRKPRDKSTNLWSPYLRQRRQGYTMEKR